MWAKPTNERLGKHMLKDVVIVSACRTAVGGFGGSLKDFSTIDLAATVTKEALSRANVDPQLVDEVVMGCVGQYGNNAFLARLVALKAGCAERTAGLTVNRLCASGLQAIATGAMLVSNGDADIVVAGGAESMSNFPFCSYNTRWGHKMGDFKMIDALTQALGDPLSDKGDHIAITAENIAEKYSLTREEIDEYAVMSQDRAIKAIENGLFKDEIIPVEVRERKETRMFDTDEHPRATSVDKLAKLRPFAKKDGVVTAGNASGINDGAAAFVLMSAAKADEMGLKPIAKVVEFAAVGVDPSIMGMGPVPATEKLLEKAGMSIDDIDLFELNEAFAAQALACVRELKIPMDKVNVNGSGISLGHPIGATGAVISVKLLSELKRRGGKYGVSSLCIGSGQGLSVLFEMV